MIFIVVKYQVLPEHAEGFIEATRPFTEATRAEPGNIFFEWSRSVEDPNEFVLVEAFQDDAGEAHVTSEHFAAGLASMRPLLAATPKIVSRLVDGAGWEPMGELVID
ncbi:putative quinol monooxygenase [Galactobacter valiniphilus]|uniref:putative quinol monooxygenase n=1 Tax=Galactobacter valiniphilus TaxID=2676122 RepID=UPI0037361170